jgi:hypothetical protein
MRGRWTKIKGGSDDLSVKGLSDAMQLCARSKIPHKPVIDAEPSYVVQ